MERLSDLGGVLGDKRPWLALGMDDSGCLRKRALRAKGPVLWDGPLPEKGELLVDGGGSSWKGA